MNISTKKYKIYCFPSKFQSIQSQQSKAHFFLIEQKKHELRSIITLKAIQKYIYNLFAKNMNPVRYSF